MKITFVGNFEAEFSTENYHKKTFESLGCTVIPIQENKCTVSQVLESALQSDMLYWTHTHGFKVGSTVDVKMMLKTLKDKKIPSVGYHLDLWMGIQREIDLKLDPYWGIEYFFTVDKLMADHLNRNTETKGFFLPAGVYEAECYLGTPNLDKYPHEIIFTGSKGYHREYPYRQKLIQWLHDTYGDRFAHYGGGGLPVVRGHELNTLIASAKVVIGDTLCKDFTYPWYSSDRLFETCGRGGVLIYPMIEGLQNWYTSAEEIVFYEYNNFDQLKALIDACVADDPLTIKAREMMRKAAMVRTIEDHTYTRRLQVLLDTVKIENEKR